MRPQNLNSPLPKFYFLCNRRSGGGISLRQIQKWEDYFQDHLPSFEFLFPENREKTISLTQDLLKNGASHLVAVGGDGTLNAVVNGLFEKGRMINPATHLFVAKAGTGGDYFRGIIRSQNSSSKDWKKILHQHEIKAVDLGLISFQNSELPPQYFINSFSVGMFPEIALQKEQGSPWLPKGVRYLYPALKTLLSYRPHTLSLELDAQRIETEALAVAVSKGPYAGGGMLFGPKTSVNNGMFEITIFPDLPLSQSLPRFPQLFQGTYKEKGDFPTYFSRAVKITSDTPLKIEFDGEIYGTTDVSLSLLPQSLQIGFPLS